MYTYLILEERKPQPLAKPMCITSDLALFSSSGFNFLMKHCLQTPFRSITSCPLATDGPLYGFLILDMQSEKAAKI